MTSRKPPANCVAIDVGGTSIRAARFDCPQLTLGEIHTCATPNHRALPDCTLEELRTELFGAMDSLVEKALGGARPELVGFAFPGPIDPQGNVLSIPTVFGSRAHAPRPIGRELAAHWPGAHVVLMNDVTAAGYYHLREPDESFCITTVSSGIGNKVFVHGRPVVGPGGRGGEIGHIVVDPSPDALECDCGGRGHLGGIASGRGTQATLRRAAMQDLTGFRNSLLYDACAGQPHRIENPAIVAAFHAADPWVCAHVRHATMYLARVLASIHNALGIERFVMMGGFALALGEGYRRMLAELTAACCWNLGQQWPDMFELSTEGDGVALSGAARAALREWEAGA